MDLGRTHKTQPHDEFLKATPVTAAWMRHFVFHYFVPSISKEVNALFTAQELMLPIGIIILPKVLTECGRGNVNV